MEKLFNLLGSLFTAVRNFAMMMKSLEKTQEKKASSLPTTTQHPSHLERIPHDPPQQQKPIQYFINQSTRRIVAYATALVITTSTTTAILISLLSQRPEPKGNPTELATMAEIIQSLIDQGNNKPQPPKQPKPESESKPEPKPTERKERDKPPTEAKPSPKKTPSPTPAERHLQNAGIYYKQGIYDKALHEYELARQLGANPRHEILKTELILIGNISTSQSTWEINNRPNKSGSLQFDAPTGTIAWKGNGGKRMMRFKVSTLSECKMGEFEGKPALEIKDNAREFYRLLLIGLDSEKKDKLKNVCDAWATFQQP